MIRIASDGHLEGVKLLAYARLQSESGKVHHYHRIPLAPGPHLAAIAVVSKQLQIYDHNGIGVGVGLGRNYQEKGMHCGAAQLKRRRLDHQYQYSFQ